MTMISLLAVRAATEAACFYAAQLQQLRIENEELKAAIERARQYVIDTRLVDVLPHPGVLLGLLDPEPTWRTDDDRR